MAGNTTSWYETFFNENYFRVFALLTPERTTREVEDIVTLLRLPEGSRVLDLCCGYGRHAIPLAEQGYRVTGLDLSAVMLERAKVDAANRQVQVQWIKSDMRVIPFEREFDAVINVATSFGYLENEDEDQQVVGRVFRALKPGGLFLLETRHRDSITRLHANTQIIRGDDLITLREGHFDLVSSRYEERVTLLHGDGRRSEQTMSVRIYTLTELTRMLEEAGFIVEAYYGGLDGTRLSLESRRPVVLSRRPV